VNHQGRIQLVGPDGELYIQMPTVMSSNNEFLLYQATRQGMGVGVLPEGLVQQDLLDQRLIELVPEYRAPIQHLFAVYTSRRYLSLKVRLLIDYLSTHLQTSV
jgi:DNA-binding transcriptional LysR family regulator